MVVRKPYKDVMSPEQFRRHAEMWMTAVLSTDDNTFHKAIANYIRNFIHDVGQRTTSYVSKEALTLKSSQRCNEHFHSRLAVGMSIVRKIKSGKYHAGNMRRMYLEIFSACRTHQTTSEENRRLSVIQNNPATAHLSWRKQYKLAGVYLVYSGSIYIIDGTKYVGWTEADMAAMLGISIYRFRKYVAPEAMQ